MISSKKITLFAILLMGVVVVLTFVAMLFFGNATPDIATGIIEYSQEHKVSLADDDYFKEFSSSENIVLSGNSAATDSRNVTIDGGVVTILGGGYYKITGELTDGSIVVNSADNAPVYLMLDNASVTSSDFSAIYVKQATKVVLSLKSGTVNNLTDASEYSEAKQENSKPDAAVYSRDDLTINGDGTLNITGNFGDGIKANDDLKIIGANINITASDDGINANNYAFIADSCLNITSDGDGIKCDEEAADKGFGVVENSVITINSNGDGMTASSSLYIPSGDFNIITGGGSGNANAHKSSMGGRGQMASSSDASSTKGIKAAKDLNIVSGSFYIDSADDTLHANGNVIISGGSYILLSGDDAVHADSNLILAPQSIDIQKCYEGLEAAYITINSGDISIISSDDGINATGFNSSGGMGAMMHGGSAKTDEEDIYLTLNGGNIRIETSGDGFDSNGSAVINGGFLEIYGPENSGNGSIDVGDGGYVLIVNGGTLLAAGSSGMAETPYNNSKINTIVFYLNEYQASGSVISITDSNGQELISGTSSKKFNWICFTDASIIEGESYTLKIDGEEVGEIIASDTVRATYSSNSKKMR